MNTLGKLAFALRPSGESPSEDEIKSLIREGSADPPLGSVAALRRLIFESQTLMTAQVRNTIEHKDEEKRELPAAERAERVKQQAARLAGVRLTGESECSHASYNVVACMVQDNVITYLPSGKFGSRQAELRLEKPKKELDIVNSSLTIRDQKQEASSDTSSALSLHGVVCPGPRLPCFPHEAPQHRRRRATAAPPCIKCLKPTAQRGSVSQSSRQAPASESEKREGQKRGWEGRRLDNTFDTCHFETL